MNIPDTLQRAFDQYHGLLGYPTDDLTLWERIADDLPEFPDEDETERALQKEYDAGYKAAEAAADDEFRTLLQQIRSITEGYDL